MGSTSSPKWPLSSALKLGAGAIIATAAGWSAMAMAQAAMADQVPGESPPRDPQFIYDRTCGYCHGHNVGPIILGRKLPAEVIATFVRHGNGAMPAFKPTEITNEELDALAEWISASEADETEHGQ